MKESIKRFGKQAAGFSLALIAAATPTVFVAASGATKYLNETGISNSLGTGSLPTMIGNFVTVVLSILGLVLVLLILYAGFLWMTAQGDAAKVKKGKDMITQAIIGLFIVFASYAIATFVIARLTEVTGTQ